MLNCAQAHCDDVLTFCYNGIPTPTTAIKTDHALMPCLKDVTYSSVLASLTWTNIISMAYIYIGDCSTMYIALPYAHTTNIAKPLIFLSWPSSLAVPEHWWPTGWGRPYCQPSQSSVELERVYDSEDLADLQKMALSQDRGSVTPRVEEMAKMHTPYSKQVKYLKQPTFF